MQLGRQLVVFRQISGELRQKWATVMFGLDWISTLLSSSSWNSFIILQGMNKDLNEIGFHRNDVCQRLHCNRVNVDMAIKIKSCLKLHKVWVSDKPETLLLMDDTQYNTNYQQYCSVIYFPNTVMLCVIIYKLDFTNDCLRSGLLKISWTGWGLNVKCKCLFCNAVFYLLMCNMIIPPPYTKIETNNTFDTAAVC